MPVPLKVASRITSGLKKFQPIVESAKAKDVNETDTVVIVNDLLQDIFGYDKYSEITSEHNIKGTFVDLAVKVDDQVIMLVEVKAIGMELKDGYVKQAVDYGSNLGVDWVILTTGVLWRIYKIHFTKPVDCELVYEFNLLELNPKNEDHLEFVWMISKEGWNKEGLKEFHTQKQTLNRFVLAALIRSEDVLKRIQRNLKKIAPGVRINTEELEKALSCEVLKREAIEGEKADAARKLVARAAKKAIAAKASDDEDDDEIDEATETVHVEPTSVTPMAKEECAK